MRAVTFEDGELVVSERPDPVAGVGQVLVRVTAAGLNGADMMQRRGLYPPPPGVTDIPGLELAGVVEALGEGASRFAVGDRVMGITAGGGQAELIVASERELMPVPDTLADIEAGGFAETFCTAHDALTRFAPLKPAEFLLVNGAAGGVGTAAIQLARCMGARVIASAHRTETHDRLLELGAADAITPDEVPANGPYDVVLELVGAPNIEPALNALAVGGRIHVIGVGAGAKTEINLLALMMKRARLSASTLRARPSEEKALVMRGVEAEVLPFVESGDIIVPVDSTYALEDAAAAYDAFAAGGKLGKIVLTV
jgi:putative PIG3 family NAD(P)H quinone oxidoreductase